jgi:four helix bundle protein
MPATDQLPRPIAERTFKFAVQIVNLCKQLGATAGVSRSISGQLLRAGTSIGANVEEGQAAQSRADFTSKYNIALKEARETRYWLRLLQATCLADPVTLSVMLQEVQELANILGASVRTAKQRS